MTVGRTLLLVLASLVLFGAAPANLSRDYETVSMSAVLADPAAYHGRKVRLHGFLILEFEGTSLWATEEDSRAGRYDRALWLEHRPDYEGIHPLNGKRVYISGELEGQGPYHGHMGMWPGAIRNVAEVAPDPTDTDWPRPWRADPLFVLLLGLGLAGLVFAMLTLSTWARRATKPDDGFAP